MKQHYAGEWPRISVVTPVRNAADTLRETIESILTQEYPNLEYIVVDGGSTDGSLELIYEYAQHIDVFLHGRDRNMYDALAKGFDAARGDIFTWLNSDDMFEPGILRRIGKVFREHADWDVIYYDGTIWKQGWRTPNRNQKVVGLPELMRGHILYQDDVFYTSRAYRAVGGLDRTRFRLAGDYDLWLRLAEHFALHYIPHETASCFRLRPGQLSGDWEGYLRDMAMVRAQAKRRQRERPPTSPGRSRLATAMRRWRTRQINKRRRLNYELRDENYSWPEVVPQPLPPLSACRCAICGRQPDRLLFSTPDTWFGDRRIWHVYYCSPCSVTCVFPPPSAGDYESLYARAASAQSGDMTNGRYRLFATPSLIAGSGLYRRASSRFRHLRERLTEVPRIREDASARIIVVADEADESVAALRAQGYTGVITAAPRYGAFSGTPPGGPARAVVFPCTLEQFADPLEALRCVRSWLQENGRVYISTPNTGSVWLERYGPCWSRWHAPIHRCLFGTRALRLLAGKAGYRMAKMSTCTPPGWLWHSEALAASGLGAFVTAADVTHAAVAMDPLWRNAVGAAVLSALRWDWRRRGDCIHVVLVRNGRADEPAP